MIKPGPAAALLDWYMQSIGSDQADEAWREYVEGVREVAEDDGSEFQARAKEMLAAGLSEDNPPSSSSEDEEDPEGFGMDEPAEGEA